MADRYEQKALEYQGFTDEALIKEVRRFKAMINRKLKPDYKIRVITAYYELATAECEKRGLKPLDDSLTDDERLLAYILEDIAPEYRERLLVVRVIPLSERTNSAKYELTFANGWYYERKTGGKRHVHKSLQVANEFSIIHTVGALKHGGYQGNEDK